MLFTPPHQQIFIQIYSFDKFFSNSAAGGQKGFLPVSGLNVTSNPRDPSDGKNHEMSRHLGILRTFLQLVICFVFKGIL